MASLSRRLGPKLLGVKVWTPKFGEEVCTSRKGAKRQVGSLHQEQLNLGGTGREPFWGEGRDLGQLTELSGGHDGIG